MNNETVVNAFADALYTEGEVLEEMLFWNYDTDREEHLASLEEVVLQSSVDDIINDPIFQKSLRELVSSTRKKIIEVIRDDLMYDTR
jgi:hypothetical protein